MSAAESWTIGKDGDKAGDDELRRDVRRVFRQRHEGQDLSLVLKLDDVSVTSEERRCGESWTTTRKGDASDGNS